MNVLIPTDPGGLRLPSSSRIFSATLNRYSTCLFSVSWASLPDSKVAASWRDSK
nr:MAG TPA: hypothetical protein [Caudoviricetes sp.]